MKTHVEFRSDRFPPYPEEDEEVNPGIWGKRLAEFLAAEYPDDGFLCFVEPSEPFVRRWFRKIPTEAQVGAVTTALASLLSSEPAIRDIKWWTKEEFDHPTAEPENS